MSSDTCSITIRQAVFTGYAGSGYFQKNVPGGPFTPMDLFIGSLPPTVLPSMQSVVASWRDIDTGRLSDARPAATSIPAGYTLVAIRRSRNDPTGTLGGNALGGEPGVWAADDDVTTSYRDFLKLVPDTEYTFTTTPVYRNSVGTLVLGPKTSVQCYIGTATPVDGATYSADFDSGTENWTARTNASNLTRDTTRDATGALRWTATTGATTAVQAPVTTVAVKPSTRYTLTAKMSHGAVGTREMRTVIDCLDANGVLTGTDAKYDATDFVPAGTGWLNVSLSFTTDATTSKARVWSQAWSSAANPISAGDAFYVNDVVLTEDVSTEPVPGDDAGTTSTSPMPVPTNFSGMYHMMWDVSDSPMLDTLPANVNVLYLAFAQSHPPKLVGWGEENDEALFVQKAKDLRARGVRIYVSIGGAGGGSMNTGDRQGFVDGIMAINAKIPLDGLDWDIEGTDMTTIQSNCIWISQELKRLRGSNFGITMAPGGGHIHSYRPFAKACQDAGVLDMIGWQFYDTEVDEPTLISRLDSLRSDGILENRLGIGMMVGAEPTYWTVDECVSRVTAAKNKYPNLRGGYLWEHGRPGVADWCARVGPMLMS